MKKCFITVFWKVLGNLQEYVLKNWGFHLKNSKWPCPGLNNATQSQISGILLCRLSIRTTFVWNILSENALLMKYFGATFKLGHPVYKLNQTKRTAWEDSNSNRTSSICLRSVHPTITTICSYPVHVVRFALGPRVEFKIALGLK